VRRGVVAAGVLVLSLLMGGARAHGADPQLQQGFPVRLFVSGGTYHGGADVHVLVGNIDADPQRELLVTGLAAGPLYAFNADGSPVAGFPTRDTGGSVYAALGDLLDDSPGFDVFASDWGNGSAKSRLHAWRGDGMPLLDWPQTAINYADTAAMLADVDGDGVDEIFLNQEDGGVGGYTADGRFLPGWSSHESGTPWWNQRLQTPAAADLNRDGSIDVAGVHDGYMYAYGADGRFLPGFPSRFADGGPTNEYVAVGDVDGDGALELVTVGGSLYVLGATGAVERTIPLPSSTSYGTAPALADLDGDDVPEIVVEQDGALTVVKGDGSTLPGFPVTWGNYWVGNGCPVVGDVDGDGQPDIVLSDHVAGLNSPTSGELRAYDRRGQLLPGFPKTPPAGSSISAPAIADIDLDGRNEIAVAGSSGQYIGYYEALFVYDLGGAAGGPVEWGQYMHDPRHQGRYGAPTTPRAPPPASGPPASSPAHLVSDIGPGTASASPLDAAALGPSLLFEADDGSSGPELWRADGSGAQLVRDIRSGASGSAPRELTPAGQTVFFVADDGSTGAELWTSDGTPAGTRLVEDIWPGAASSDPHNLRAVGDTVYFSAWDGVHGFELWRSDGTAAGTALVKDLLVGTGADPTGEGAMGDPRLLTAVGSSLFFTAIARMSPEDLPGSLLFRSDGTTAGTVPLARVPGAAELENVSGTVYFTDGDQLGRSDGTSAGSSWFADPFYGYDAITSRLTNVNGTLFFHAQDGGLGTELWHVNGSGVAMVKDAAPGNGDAEPRFLTPLDGAVYYGGNDDVSGQELWRSDGTDAGTQLVRDIRNGAAGSDPRLLTRVGSLLYFSADDGASGQELWQSDGTATGTQLVQDVAPGGRGSSIGWLVRAGDNLFFSADDGTHGLELWALPLAAGGGGGDVTPPRVTLTAPNAGSYRSAIDLSADASDDTAVDHVDFLVDGAVVGTDSTSPYAISWGSGSVADGTHAIAARAVDSSGNGATSAAQTITTDNTPPASTITSKPPAQSTSTTATFAFVASESATFECQLDGVPWTACESPKTYTNLGDGQHAFAVRATDTVGNVEPAKPAFTWYLDATPPETTITSGPTRSKTSVYFQFTSSEPGSTFRCSLDGAANSACSSPARYDHLHKGTHTFGVYAIDPYGNVDPTPATRTWTQ
jgi:ELWxxDGT repeat protein